MKNDSIKFSNTKQFLEYFIRLKQYSALFIIADKNACKKNPDYFTNLDIEIPVLVFPLKGGESCKNIRTATAIWKEMLKSGIDKDALLINFGGGSICDIGGFVASTYKRGLEMINIPTTLLAMIDAAIGGKNGINLKGIKNVAGTFYLPVKVLIETEFMKTLSKKELLSGYGELLKYALIANSELWNELINLNHINSHSIQMEWISEAIDFKNSIVGEDVTDTGKRHILNFGHTTGHALESYFYHKKEKITHGHAVALGICCEAYISYLQNFISLKKVEIIKKHIKSIYLIPSINPADFETIAALCLFDKKNTDKKINVTLLKNIGQSIHNQITNKEEIIKSLEFLLT